MTSTTSKEFKFYTLDVVVDTPRFVNGQPLKMACRRYSATASPSGTGITLIFLHGFGNHKEQWEPVMSRLMQCAAQSTDTRVPSIREAWAFDWQTHGDSAVLNAEAFTEPYSRTSIADWAAAVADFLKARLLSHRIVCVGHSGGALTLLYSTLLWHNVSGIPYEAMILIEPATVDRDAMFANARDRKRLDKMLKIVLSRRDEWDSYDAAHEWFLQRIPWSTWDPLVVQLFVYKGLRPVSPGATKVTTKCDRKHEAEGFTEHQAMFQAAEQVSRICDHIPLHLVYGEHNDFALRDSKKSLTDVNKGRRVASLSIIPGAGHMAVQQQPGRLAELLWDILSKPTRHLPTNRVAGPARL